MMESPPNHFTLSLLTCLFCCWPISILALLNSLQVISINALDQSFCNVKYIYICFLTFLAIGFFSKSLISFNNIWKFFQIYATVSFKDQCIFYLAWSTSINPTHCTKRNCLFSVLFNKWQQILSFSMTCQYLLNVGLFPIASINTYSFQILETQDLYLILLCLV